MFIEEQIIDPYKYQNAYINKIIGNNVCIICEGSFMKSNLEYASFGSSLEVIEEDAFYNCYKLKSISLPTTLKFIGDNAFNCCKQLSVKLPSHIQYIGVRAFQNCNCRKLIIPGTLARVSTGAFSYNKISDLTINYGVRAISNEAFIGNKIKTLTVPDSILFISNTAFSDVECVKCDKNSYSYEFFKRYYKNCNIIFI